MRNRVTTLGVVAILVVLSVSVASAASRGASFTPIGLFPHCDDVGEGEFCENFPLTTVVSMTADGQTIAGMHAFFSGGYLWTADTGLQTVGPIDGAIYISDAGTRVSSDSFDETFTYGFAANWNGVFWDFDLLPDDIWTPIPLADGFSFCDFSGQGTFGNSDDWITGLTWLDLEGTGNGCRGARAFVWSEGTGTVVLDSSVNDDSTRGNAINDDGSVVVGWMQTNQREATKWVNGVQDFLCPDAIGAGGDNFCTEGWDVTPDGGLMLTSMATPVDFNTRATLVDQAGNAQQLPDPDAPFDPFWDKFQGWAVSNDGNTVVGEFGGGGFFGSPPYPVLWNRDLGATIDVQVFLLGQGLDDLFFWFLDDATAVSGDGTIIAGSGVNPDGWIEAWTADISRVKVCHKPDGDSNGARRTITIGWSGVADHMGHGDILSTCEFALADGHSRAMAGREAMVRRGNDHPARDARIGTMDELKRMQTRTQQGAFGPGSTTNPYAGATTDGSQFAKTGEAAEGGQTAEQRELLIDRIERFRGRR